MLVVAIPGDSSFAPGRTFAVQFKDLFVSDAPSGCAPPSCCPPGCSVLPGLEILSEAYVIPADVALKVMWNLGNGGSDTALPVQASFTPLWGATGEYATAVGLPLEPVQASLFYNPLPTYLGPGGGPSLVFETYLQAGLQYELAAQPDPPFSAAYPPAITSFTANVGRFYVGGPTDRFDVTTEETDLGHTVIPQFDISRAAGLDGWTAYLRDTTTGAVLSNIATLGGSEAPSVLLATNRFAADQHQTDALSNAELVVVPPPGAIVPTGVFAPAGQELPSAETYPPLPAPVTVTGAIADASGTPVLADLTFQATAIVAGGIENTANFEYVGRATSTIDPTTGAATYQIVLPPGQYLAVARPRDSSTAMTFAAVDVPAQTGILEVATVTLGEPRSVTGHAVVADGRPLAAATVDVVPLACATLPVSISKSAGGCLPRPAQTTTALDGSFALALDPGGYLLRVRPADGTRLPWVTLPIPASAGALALPTIAVPAPIDVGLKLVDPNDNPIVRAVVSVYSLPADGAAVELGNAITDASGRYEMYVNAEPQ